MIPAWAGGYIGLPYKDKGRGPDGWDCWGGARMVLCEVFGHDLPDYSDAYARSNDGRSVSAAVKAGLADGWEPVDRPKEGDLLILRIAGRPWHCAVMLDAMWFLHWPPPSKDGRQLLSCRERLDSPQWSKRIEGIYRRSVAN